MNCIQSLESDVAVRFSDPSSPFIFICRPLPNIFSEYVMASFQETTNDAPLPKKQKQSRDHPLERGFSMEDHLVKVEPTFKEPSYVGGTERFDEEEDMSQQESGKSSLFGMLNRLSTN